VVCHRSFAVEPTSEVGTAQVDPESSHIEEADPMRGNVVPTPNAVKVRLGAVGAVVDPTSEYWKSWRIWE
jgi:hypothetical protein